jgi:hypothetical protein
MQNTDVARRIELGPTRSTRGRRLYHPYKRTPSPLAQRRPRDAAWDVPGADWTSAVAVVEEAARDGVLDAFEVGHSPSSARRRYVVDASSVQYTALWHRLNPGLPNADAQEHVAQGGEAGAFKVDHTRPLALPTRRSRVPLTDHHHHHPSRDWAEWRVAGELGTRLPVPDAAWVRLMVGRGSTMWMGTKRRERCSKPPWRPTRACRSGRRSSDAGLRP